MAQQYIISLLVGDQVSSKEDILLNEKVIKKLQHGSFSVLVFETCKCLVNFPNKFSEESVSSDAQTSKYELVFWDGEFTLTYAKRLISTSSDYLPFLILKVFGIHLEKFLVKQRKSSFLMKVLTLPSFLALKVLNSSNAGLVQAPHLHPVTIN